MKTHRFPLFLSILLLGSLLIAGCTGAATVRTWPGISATDNAVYLADAGRIYAINTSNGSSAWMFPADKPDNSKPFYAPPAISDQQVVAGSYGHLLHGLDPKQNGKQIWVYDTGDGNFVGSPLVLSDTILAPSSNNKLYALTTDGKLRWTFQAKNALWGTPASDGQVAYVPGLDHNLYAVKVADGSLIWKKDMGSALLSAPLLTKDGTLYLSAMDGKVIALKASDGSPVWTANVGGRLWSSPMLSQDLLYVGNSDGKALAISVKDGSITKTQDAKSPILAGAAAIPNGVVFVTEGGNVIAYDAKLEKELWRQTINGKLYSTPVVSGQTLVVAITEGQNSQLLQAYNVNGQVSWPFTAPK